MSDKLKLTAEALDGAQTAIQTARTDFSQAGTVSDEIATAAGQPYLQEQVHTFASNWRVHRERLMKSMDSLASQIQGVVGGFTKADVEMAKQIGPQAGAVSSGGTPQARIAALPGSGQTPGGLAPVPNGPGSDSSDSEHAYRDGYGDGFDNGFDDGYDKGQDEASVHGTDSDHDEAPPFESIDDPEVGGPAPEVPIAPSDPSTTPDDQGGTDPGSNPGGDGGISTPGLITGSALIGAAAGAGSTRRGGRMSGGSGGAPGLGGGGGGSGSSGELPAMPENGDLGLTGSGDLEPSDPRGAGGVGGEKDLELPGEPVDIYADGVPDQSDAADISAVLSGDPGGGSSHLMMGGVAAGGMAAMGGAKALGDRSEDTAPTDAERVRNAKRALESMRRERAEKGAGNGVDRENS